GRGADVLAAPAAGDPPAGGPPHGPALGQCRRGDREGVGPALAAGHHRTAPGHAERRRRHLQPSALLWGARAPVLRRALYGLAAGRTSGATVCVPQILTPRKRQDG